LRDGLGLDRIGTACGADLQYITSIFFEHLVFFAM
jgi:hypothetical protein